MRNRYGAIEPSARGFLVAAGILAIVPAASAGDKKGDALPAVVTSAPAGCKRLGEVLGKHVDATHPRVDWAQENALKQAQKLGATHVVTAASGVQHKTAYFKGIAFRCPAPPASPRGK